MIKSVPELLRDLGKIYEDRNPIYGDNYKRFGPIMAQLFPGGITLKTEDDHNRFGIFVQVVAKVTRYAAQFSNGGHPDSLDDGAVYSMMLQELDSEIRERADADSKPPESPRCDATGCPGRNECKKSISTKGKSGGPMGCDEVSRVTKEKVPDPDMKCAAINCPGVVVCNDLGSCEAGRSA